jgi:hypothetical protein
LSAFSRRSQSLFEEANHARSYLQSVADVRESSLASAS